MEGVPEPGDSSNYIIAHLLGAKSVSWKVLILHCPACVVTPASAFRTFMTCFHRWKVLNTHSYQSFSDEIRQSRYGGSAPNVCQGVTLPARHLHTFVSR